MLGIMPEGVHGQKRSIEAKCIMSRDSLTLGFYVFVVLINIENFNKGLWTLGKFPIKIWLLLTFTIVET
jgi:hypothetical protein